MCLLSLTPSQVECHSPLLFSSLFSAVSLLLSSATWSRFVPKIKNLFTFSTMHCSNLLGPIQSTTLTYLPVMIHVNDTPACSMFGRVAMQ